MPNTKPSSRKPAAAVLLILLLAAVGLAACGGSSSTTTQTTADAAATNAAGNGATSTGASASGTSSTGASTSTTANGTPPNGSSSTATGPAGTPNPGHFTAVRACLAKKGITLPQRGAGTPGLPGGAPGLQLPKGMTHAQLTEALKSCGGGFPGNHFRRGFKGSRTPLANPRFHQALVNFSACLRQNGVDVGEPNTSGKGPIFNTKGINTGSPKFREASAKCRSALFGSLRPKASPGTAGGGAHS
jgi:hypothetical protein